MISASNLDILIFAANQISETVDDQLNHIDLEVMFEQLPVDV